MLFRAAEHLTVLHVRAGWGVEMDQFVFSRLPLTLVELALSHVNLDAQGLVQFYDNHSRQGALRALRLDYSLLSSDYQAGAEYDVVLPALRALSPHVQRRMILPLFRAEDGTWQSSASVTIGPGIRDFFHRLGPTVVASDVEDVGALYSDTKHGARVAPLPYGQNADSTWNRRRLCDISRLIAPPLPGAT